MQWLNRYLAPSDCSAELAEHILTEAGLPIEEHKPLENGDTVIDVEVTSNRSDCLSHIGIAREIAAARYTDERFELVMPPINDPTPGAPIGNELTLENRVPDQCPLFTARLLRNVKIGPSPKWLVEALESMGARSINNVVDVTNYITYELGNPCHVFDHKKLAGGALIVRYAKPGEKVKTLYAGEHELRATDLVVADTERPQSLAGIIGGYDSQVDENTTTVVFEMATWDPSHVRNTGRRLGIRTDAAYRFERGLDPRTIEDAARRAVELICEVSGAELAEGVLREGAPLPQNKVVELRQSRCDTVLGVPTDPSETTALLEALSIRVEDAGNGVLRCSIPPHRSHDLTREIDLIEEVARARSLGVVPARNTIDVTIREPQPSEKGVNALGDVLTGMGFFETITYSFTSEDKAKLVLRVGSETVSVDDDRRKLEPTLRPSVLLGLLSTRRANQDARTSAEGGIRLFEIASSFAQKAGTRDSLERRQLAVLMDVERTKKKASDEDKQRSIRIMRALIDQLVQTTFGVSAQLVVTPCDPVHQGYQSGAHATIAVRMGDALIELGSFGLISDAARKAEGLDEDLVGAELWIDDLVAPYPPLGSAALLPQFPGIDRDLSLILDESTTWRDVDELVENLRLDRCVGREFVSTFRGKQIGDGKKSLTLRVQFRDDSRTLTHEEVDPQMAQLAESAKSRLSAEIRV